MPSLAQGAEGVDTGDTAWVLLSAALVMVMTPAVGLFYGGMVRRKNANSVIVQSFIILALVSLQWVVLGYTLAFGSDVGGVIGGPDHIGLEGVGSAPSTYAPNIPHMAFVVFQAMFAVITPALVIGAFAERMKLSAFILFVVLWSTLVYDPIAHWVWGAGGWLRGLGALDFAGGTVVHVSSGVSALAAALVVGRRIGFKANTFEPHNVPMSLLGGVILWFGWFGFNAGSALAAGDLAANAFLVTNTAAAASALTWMLLSWYRQERPGALGVITGGVAGLVAITPASGFVGPLAAIAIGMGAGAFSYIAMSLRSRTRIDDALDVWACHGVSGTWGAIATGIFASIAVNAAGANGLIYGNFGIFAAQLLAVGVVWAYSFGVTILLLGVLDRAVGLRVNADEEIVGLDISQHGETAYS